MKKLLFAFALTSALFSCKKETTNTTNSNTTNNPNSVSCGDNPNINFSAVGTPLGKFSDCIKDVEGNVYKTVQIGTQTWMAENLKTSKYSDGTIIPNLKENQDWSNASSSKKGAWCYYNNDTLNNARFGKLYNWYVVSYNVNSGKNICPTGWHVPSKVEWTVLTDNLGGLEVAGAKLKETGVTNWTTPNLNTTNTSLFTALPGGYRFQWGDFTFKNNMGYWWSSDELSTSLTNAYSLDFSSIKFKTVEGWSKGYASSIRCIKD